MEDNKGEFILDEKVTQYLVPANVSTRFEFFTGFGWHELRIVAGAITFGLLIFLGLGVVSPGIPAFSRGFAIIIPGAGTFLLVKKDPSTGMSLLKLLNSAKQFQQKQKRYMYKYGSGSGSEG